MGSGAISQEKSVKSEHKNPMDVNFLIFQSVFICQDLNQEQLFSARSFRSFYEAQASKTILSSFLATKNATKVKNIPVIIIYAPALG
jgi:hypothetical protein